MKLKNFTILQIQSKLVILDFRVVSEKKINFHYLKLNPCLIFPYLLTKKACLLSNNSAKCLFKAKQNDPLLGNKRHEVVRLSFQ